MFKFIFENNIQDGNWVYMKLRTKTIVTIIVFSLFMFSALQIISYTIIQPNFLDIEIQENIEKTDRAKQLLNYSILDVQVKVTDYALWDDTYQFVKDQNQQYLQSNFVDSTFQNLKLNFVAIVNNQKELLYSQSYDLNESRKTETSSETEQMLISCNHLWVFESIDSKISGLILVENKPMIISTSPILTSQKQGPINGGILFGKYLDNIEIIKLTNIADFNFSINTIEEFELEENQIATQLISNEHTTIIKEKSEDIISGYTLLKDVHDNQSFVLTVTSDRTVHKQSLLVGNVFLFSSIGISILIGIILLILLEKEIVKPMRKLASNIEELTVNPDASVSNNTQTVDELSIVSEAVTDTVKRKLEGINEVSRMVAHDLRNPLSGIRNSTFLLKKKYGPEIGEDGKNMLKTIDECVTYSDKIVQNLLEYSTEIKLEKTITNPKELVANSLTKLIIPQRIKIINEATDKENLMVDTSKIERVFVNLIMNGIEAMQDGGTLKIKTQKKSEMVQIDFIDTGSGMSKEVIQKLWTPFFTTKPKGMGIGLNICKRIVEAHEGKIEVESTPGNGTKFSVFLPKIK